MQVAAGQGDVRYAGNLNDASATLLAGLRPGDVLITLGAGDGDRVGRQVLAGLRSQVAHSAPHSSTEDRYQALATAIAQETGLAVRRDEALAAHTTLRIGGPADVFVAVAALDDLVTVWRLAHELGVPALLLGGGSNLLVSDAGVRGLVISNGCRAVQRHEGHVVWAESGANLAGLARQTMRWGLSGLEWGVSVPGTVGGAVVGNAGAHGGCMADNLLRVTLMGADGARSEWPVRRLDYGYRRSRLKAAIQHGEAAPVVLAAAFQMQPGDSAEMEARAAAFLAHRRSTQPVEPSAGSMFQNPPGDYAGRIIESLGLKGAEHGGAAFSTVHANFIVNRGGATAVDVLALVNEARRRAWDTLGVPLQPEILFVGEWAAGPLQPLTVQPAERPSHEASL